MTARAEFAYAQARLQARHGAGPQPLVWQALETSRTAGHYLAVARSGPMAQWVDGLGDAEDAHQIERHLRARWRCYVDQVALWLPARWQPATRWFGTLSELPLIDALQHDPAAAQWLQGDPHLAVVAERSPAGSAIARWLAEWSRLLPADADAPALLRQPANLLLPRLIDASSVRAAAAEPTRRALLRLFRRHAGSALAVLAHLALVALDVERLRGGLVVRVLFDAKPRPETA